MKVDRLVVYTIIASLASFIGISLAIGFNLKVLPNFPITIQRVHQAIFQKSSQNQIPRMEKQIPEAAILTSVTQYQDASVHGSNDLLLSTYDQTIKSNKLIISDILTKTRKVNVFASLTRDFEHIATRLNDETRNTTVLAPFNSVIQSLPRKLWEDPKDYERSSKLSAYHGEGGEDRARWNLKRFVEAHLVPVCPWKEGEEVETIGGEKLIWVKEGDKIIIQPGHIEVESSAPRVLNGEVWILKGVINYD